MRAEVADHARPGELAVEPPRVGAVGRVAGVVAQVDVVRPADVAVGDQPPHPLVDRHVVVRERHERDRAGLLGARCHRLRLRRVLGERLLAQHVQATVERRHRQREVAVVGAGDDDRVELSGVEHRDRVVEPALDAPPVGERRRRGRIAAADRHHHRLLVRRQRRRVHRVGPPAGSDQADANHHRRVSSS